MPDMEGVAVYAFLFVLLGVGVWGAMEVTHPLGRVIILSFDMLLFMTIFGGWKQLGEQIDRAEEVTGIKALGESIEQPGPSWPVNSYVCERCEATNYFDLQYPVGSMKCAECGYILDDQFAAREIAANNHDD